MESSPAGENELPSTCGLEYLLFLVWVGTVSHVLDASAWKVCCGGCPSESRPEGRGFKGQSKDTFGLNHGFVPNWYSLGFLLFALEADRGSSEKTPHLIVFKPCILATDHRFASGSEKQIVCSMVPFLKSCTSRDFM